ncbi:MAG: YjbQ family protein [Thermoprotei archaeon]|nr:MAG: YjbQ family protein [Thermoprotei archaeon]
MKARVERVKIITNKKTEIIDITDLVRNVVKRSGIKDGLINIFTRHTTAGIFLNENESGLIRDFVNYLHKIVPEDDNYYHHHFFYKDGRAAVNAWAHIRSVLLGHFVVVPLKNGDLLLGDRQRIFFTELDGPQSREVIIQVLGE